MLRPKASDVSAQIPIISFLFTQSMSAEVIPIVISAILPMTNSPSV